MTNRRGALGGIVRWSAALSWIGALAIARAQEEPKIFEHQIKAAYLYKFLGFVEWPERMFDGPNSPFVIGVLGADSLADALTAVAAHRQVNGRTAATRKLKMGDPLTGLHILFVGRAVDGRTASTLAAAKDLAVLTVTETEEGFSAGSSINFVVVDNKVRFDVALHTADAKELKISSRLLSVARRVVGAAS